MPCKVKAGLLAKLEAPGHLIKLLKMGGGRPMQNLKPDMQPCLRNVPQSKEHQSCGKGLPELYKNKVFACPLQTGG